MVTKESLDSYIKALKDLNSPLPSFHCVLGSGFGEVVNHLDSSKWQELGRISFGKIHGLIPSSVQDHAGEYRLFQHKQTAKVWQVQMGRLHGYEGYSPRLVVQTVMIPRATGVENFLLTNAAGGLDTSMNPGDVMIISDQVNMTGNNPLVGHNPVHPTTQKEWGPRFPDMGQVFKPEWRSRLKHLLTLENLRVFEGTYLGLLGPNFETHAEVRLFASWGLKAVGMSTVWEVLALQHSGAKIAGISLISNLGAGLDQNPLNHQMVLQTSRKSAQKIFAAIEQFATQDLFQ